MFYAKSSEENFYVWSSLFFKVEHLQFFCEPVIVSLSKAAKMDFPAISSKSVYNILLQPWSWSTGPPPGTSLNPVLQMLHCDRWQASVCQASVMLYQRRKVSEKKCPIWTHTFHKGASLRGHNSLLSGFKAKLSWLSLASTSPESTSLRSRGI